MEEKRYASAILYYTKAGDTPRLTKIAHNFLDEYIETGIVMQTIKTHVRANGKDSYYFCTFRRVDIHKRY